MKNIAFKRTDYGDSFNPILSIWVDPTYVNNLAEDLCSKFGIAVTVYNNIEIRLELNPRVEDTDIEKMKEFATKWIELHTL